MRILGVMLVVLLLIALFIWPGWLIGRALWDIPRDNQNTVLAPERTPVPPVDPIAPPIEQPAAQTFADPAPAIDGITKGDTVDIEPGQMVLGDVIFTNPETQKLVDAYDNGGTGEGTVFWNNGSQTVSVHAPWGAGRKIITSQEAAMAEVMNELRQGCGDPNGCETVRFVTTTGRGIQVEYYSDDDVK